MTPKLLHVISSVDLAGGGSRPTRERERERGRVFPTFVKLVVEPRRQKRNRTGISHVCQREVWILDRYAKKTPLSIESQKSMAVASVFTCYSYQRWEINGK